MAGDPDVMREAQEGLPGDRPHLQEPHRRLQPAAVPDRKGKGESAQAVRLHQRRRRHPGAALRQLEGRVHGAALQRHDAGLGRAVHAAAAAEDLQPADRPVRVRRHHVEHATTSGSSTTHYILYGAFIVADKFAATFKEFPIIQKPNTFTIDDALAMMKEASTGGKQ